MISNAWYGRPSDHAEVKLPSVISATPDIEMIMAHPILGDVDGDGFDDFFVQAMVALDPSAEVWDPDSAAAVFGADFYTDRSGQPLTISSAGDLDGDGYSDLFARSEESTFVFYGGPQLTGKLGPDRADAQLRMPSGCDPYAIGDLDGDGRTDFAACGGASIDFVYGSKPRFSGDYTAHPDFSIEISEVGGSLLSAAAGDVNSDGAPVLVVSAIRYSESAPEELATLRFMYAIRGTGARRTGIHTVSTSEGALGPAYDLGVITPRDLATRFNDHGSLLSVAGDLDGDGSDDILTEGLSVIAQSAGLQSTLADGNDTGRRMSEGVSGFPFP